MVPPPSAGPRGFASVHRCPHFKRVRARGGLIDHQPGDHVGSQSRLVSSDPLKSDPSSDRPAITPLYLKLSADQPTPLVSLDPPLTGAVQLLVPSIYTPRRSIMLQEPATKYKSSSPSLSLSLCHSDCPCTLAHLFSLFLLPTPLTSPSPRPLHSPPYTNPTLINCGAGNYTYPTGKNSFASIYI